jgi:hypothetical protein
MEITLKLKIIFSSLLLLLALSACARSFRSRSTPAPADPAQLLATTPLAQETPVEMQPLEGLSSVDAADAAGTPVVQIRATEKAQTDAQDGPPPGLAVLEGEGWDMHLIGTLEQKDVGTLKWMMGERFVFIDWKHETVEVGRQEALERMRKEFFVDSSAPAVMRNTDMPTLLGADPLTQWGSDVNAVRAMHVMGLANQGGNEAVFVIALDSSGQRYLHGVIIPPGGYFQKDADADRINRSDVEWIKALENVRLRTGPGLNYATEGLVLKDQVVRVTGISQDGNWWRVSCSIDASGNCWVTADPNLTTPTTAP